LDEFNIFAVLVEQDVEQRFFFSASVPIAAAAALGGRQTSAGAQLDAKAGRG
jgi:hypothetical protein